MYAALDVTMPLVIVFNYIIHWCSVYSVHDLNNPEWEVSWDTLLQKVFGRVVDRVLSDKMMAG